VGPVIPPISEIAFILSRTLVLYVLVLVVMRLMGKRSVANMAPFDIAVIIMIGAAAAMPIEEETMRIAHGVVPVVALAVLQIGLSFANLFYPKLEQVTQGVATLLVKDGRVLRNNLRKERVTVSDLTMALREKEVENVSEVQEAWLEPNGKVSVLKRPEARALSKAQLEQSALRGVELLTAQAMLRLEDHAGRLAREAGGLAAARGFGISREMESRRLARPGST